MAQQRIHLLKDSKQGPPHFFYKTESVYSQFHPCEFQVDNVVYCCAEQYMMASKAREFKDEKTLQKIMKEKDPKKIKALGRKVTPFDPTVWNAKAPGHVETGNYAKFSQNEHLKKEMLASGNRLLVEASPKDKIWGIGLSEKQARNTPQDKWPGKNQLGQALMKVRSKLQTQEKRDEACKEQTEQPED